VNPGSKLLVRTALFLALAVLFPVIFHQFGMAGRLFLPMHIPVLLAMPPSYAVPLMTIELSLYGLTAGLFYYKLRLNIYIALIISLVLGRIGFAIGLLVLGLFINLPYGLAEYFSVAVVPGLPGIIIQLVFIPPIVAAVMRRERS